MICARFPPIALIEMGHVKPELNNERLIHPQPFPICLIGGYRIPIIGVTDDDSTLVTTLRCSGVCGDEMRDCEGQDCYSNYYRHEQN